MAECTHGCDAPDDTPKLHEVQALVMRAKKGEADAFDALYRRYANSVFLYIYVRVRHRQTAEDLTSHVFLRVLSKIGSFKWQGKDFAAWLTTIARNLIIDHYKKVSQRKELAVADLLETDLPINGQSKTPEAELLEKIDNQPLYHALAQLTPQERQCIILRVLVGRTITETRREMNLRLTETKLLEEQALRKLAHLLQHETLPDI